MDSRAKRKVVEDSTYTIFYSFIKTYLWDTQDHARRAKRTLLAIE